MRRLTSPALLALALILAACGGSDTADEETPTTASPTTESAASGPEITIADFSFSGADTAVVGETVTVTNEDSVGHTWTAQGGAFDSGTLATGESFEFTFEEAGEFEYFCSIHPQMTGTITVDG